MKIVFMAEVMNYYYKGITLCLKNASLTYQLLVD